MSDFKLLPNAIIEYTPDPDNSWSVVNLRFQAPSPHNKCLHLLADKEWISILRNEDGWDHEDRVEFFELAMDFLFQKEKAAIFKELLKANPVAEVATLWQRAHEVTIILEQHKLLGVEGINE